MSTISMFPILSSLTPDRLFLPHVVPLFKCILTISSKLIGGPQSFALANKLIQIATPNNVPLIIEIEGVQLSPYFSVNGPTLDIQFYDFTLEIPEQVEQNQFQENQDSQQNVQKQNKSRKNQIIRQQPNQESVQSQQLPQYPDIQISRYNMQYFNEAMVELKKMKATQEEIRQFVMEYIVEENQIYDHVQDFTLEELIQIAKENLRPVGPISWLQRKIKVSKYIQKKKKRVWKKKISYDCRKRVADNRLRVKGKFVTKKQACNILGVEELSQQDLKLLLEAKTTKTSE